MSTIVALATPPGIGALHVIRMSGSRAFEIVNRITQDKIEVTTDRLQVTFVKSRNGQFIDQVVISKYYSPNSYTGEDCIEISCHGNGIISKLIIDELIKAGAVYAEKGEFTKRAFLNNKIDLNQAINIGKLFNSSSELEIYSSIQEIKGESSKIIRENLVSLKKLMADCEINIDYPREIEREDVNFLKDIRNRSLDIYKSLDSLLIKSKKQRFSNYRIVVVGKPNAGKSSLINFFIGKDKIIVSDRSGTTQDPIEVDFCFEEYLLTIVDTAGIDTEDDILKFDAAKKSQYELRGADLLIYLVSSEDSMESDFWANQLNEVPVIRIITKSDLIDKTVPNSISVKKGDIDYFLQELRSHLRQNYISCGIRSQEGINYLTFACHELYEVIKSEDLSVDLIAEHVNSAHDYLSSILYCHNDNLSKINYIFDNFCVGK